MRTLPCAICVIVFALAATFVSGGESPQTKLDQLPTGLAARIGTSVPQRLALTPPLPGVKTPPDITAPRYAILKFGAKESIASIWVLLDEPPGKPARLFVDSNTNNDLTDDPPSRWLPTEYQGKDGAGWTQYSGQATVKAKYGASVLEWTLQFYRFDPRDPAHEADKNTLFYYADYVREGTVNLEGRNYRALLADPAATGDYRGPEARLFLDLNGDGKYDARTEGFMAARPFKLNGVTFEIWGMTASGNVFHLERSRIDLTGPKAPAFRAVAIDGKAVNFPAAYKGQLVLLNFWATWHGPTVRETPNLVAAYKKYHSQGLEIISISLDKPNQATNVLLFSRQQHVAWPQVYDGKYWQAAVAKLYDVREIPAGVLVDADSSVILASGIALTGSRLDKTLASTLAGKKKPPAPPSATR